METQVMIINRVFAASASHHVRASRACGSIAAALVGLAAIVPPASALAPGDPGVRVTIPVSGIADYAQAAVVDPNGNVVLAGSIGGNGATGGTKSVLARLTAGGALDFSFGTMGIATHDLSVNQGDGLRALVRMDDGRYVG